VGIRDIPTTVSTAAQDKLQPWQAVFAIFTYVITQFDISDVNNLILIAIVATTLGFVMRSTYKHKEQVKEVVAPWLLERVIQILSDYLPKTAPPTATPTPEPIVDGPTREELIAKLKEYEVKE